MSRGERCILSWWHDVMLGDVECSHREHGSEQSESSCAPCRRAVLYCVCPFMRVCVCVFCVCVFCVCLFLCLCVITCVCLNTVLQWLKSNSDMSAINIQIRSIAPPPPQPRHPISWSPFGTLQQAFAGLGHLAQRAVDASIYAAVFASPIAVVLYVAWRCGAARRLNAACNGPRTQQPV